MIHKRRSKRKSRLRLLVAVVAMFAFGIATSVSAADAPAAVMAQVTKAAKTCRSLGGRPDMKAMLRAQDLNHDGKQDWIVDFAKARCTGAPGAFCGSGGCALQIFLGSQGGTWKRAFDKGVEAYRIHGKGKQTVLEVDFGGSVCGKPDFQSCRKSFVIGGQAIRPAR